MARNSASHIPHAYFISISAIYICLYTLAERGYRRWSDAFLPPLASRGMPRLGTARARFLNRHIA